MAIVVKMPLDYSIEEYRDLSVSGLNERKQLILEPPELETSLASSSNYASFLEDMDKEMKKTLGDPHLFKNQPRFISFEEASKDSREALKSFNTKWDSYAKDIARELTIFDEMNEEESQ